MRLPKHIKTPAQIADILAEHDARVSQDGYVITPADNQELMLLLQAEAKYLGWVATYGVPDAI